jgi:hypothetical protein
MIRALSAALLAFACLNVIAAAPAYARKHHTHHGAHAVAHHDATSVATRRAQRIARASRRAVARDAQAMADVGNGPRQVQVVGGRPAGCPRQYCGCGTSLKIFGRIRPELNLASNWLRKFPRTAAAPSMVAARAGHVMVLLEHVGGDKWKVWDSNSGGGLTRIHVRSIRGFAVVNPHATLAQAS